MQSVSFTRSAPRVSALRPRARACRAPPVLASAAPAVLITGASTGIGKATAIYLAEKGWRVFAGVRRTQDGDALVRDGPAPASSSASGQIVPVIMDVTSDESVATAMQVIAAQLRESRSNLRGLVNNAGKGVFLPLEVMPMSVFDDVMAVNVSGVVRVTKEALPLLRATSEDQAPGRIVNLGSYAGTIATPLFGAYAASKFALEAISDSLRYELRPWGIHTALIKAGGVKTPIWDKSIASSQGVVQQGVDPAAMAPYQGMSDEMIALARSAEEKGISAQEVAATVLEALTAPRPRSRYLIGNGAERDMTARRLLPDWAWDAILLSKLPKTRGDGK